jgi:hypothetical protein
MNKTKEEIIEFIESHGMDFTDFEIDNEYSAKNLLNAMEEYGNQRFKEGFESFRGKVEEEINKQESGWLSISREEVLTTIQDIKQ